MFTGPKALFFLLTNAALTLVVGLGIYSFSQSLLWAIVGALAITGAASANPIFAFLAYPAVEYFFNGGNLTKYSAISLGLNGAQLALIVYMVVSESRKR